MDTWPYWLPALRELGSWLEALAPLIALAGFIVLLVVVINLHGRHLERHQEWLRKLDVRVGNLHKKRDEEWRRSLQLQRPPLAPGEPPPLSEANTIEVTDEMLVTLKLQSQKRKDSDDGNE